MKIAGVNIGLETVLIFGAGVIAGRWILPSLVHGMASTKVHQVPTVEFPFGKGITGHGCPRGYCTFPGDSIPCTGFVNSIGACEGL